MNEMVKCTVCGAVFDSELAVCPVCRQGPDFFVPYEEEKKAANKDTEETFVVLGGGPAGLGAVEAIRERNATCTIRFITDEAVCPYHRPMLTKRFDAHAAGLPVHPDTWYDQHRVTLLRERRVQALDSAQQVVTLEGGEKIGYDKCVYALGASSFVPQMPGIALPEVSVLRSARDVERVTALLAGGRRKVVVIGGGVLGLEAAWALKGLQCEVTIVEASPRIMSRQLDEEASALLRDCAEREGIAVVTGGGTRAIEDTDGHVSGVLLDGDVRLEAELVIVSVGVRANMAVAQAAGAKVNRGVLVDMRMRTSLPNVYACGDCAEIDGPNAQLWPVAAEMGRVAGANAAGDALEYKPGSFAVTFHGMHTKLYAEGDAGTRPDVAYRVEATRDAARQTLEKTFYVGDALVGVILIGDISKAGAYSKKLAK